MKQSTKNRIAVQQAVALYARREGWGPKHARRIGRMTDMCVRAESGGQMYANSGDPETLKLPHDTVGKDHDSAGLFQQRRSWGSASARMNVKLSTFMFLDAAERRGMLGYGPPNTLGYDGQHRIRDLADRIQNVQVSWADGRPGHPAWGANYRAHAIFSKVFVLRYWIPGKVAIRGKNYL